MWSITATFLQRVNFFSLPFTLLTKLSRKYISIHYLCYFFLSFLALTTFFARLSDHRLFSEVIAVMDRKYMRIRLRRLKLLGLYLINPPLVRLVSVRMGSARSSCLMSVLLAGKLSSTSLIELTARVLSWKLQPLDLSSTLMACLTCLLYWWSRERVWATLCKVGYLIFDISNWVSLRGFPKPHPPVLPVGTVDSKPIWLP